MGRSLKRFKVMELSLHSSQLILTKTLAKMGILEAPEYEVLKSWFSFILNHFKNEVHVDLIIYFKTTPAKAFERINSRSRDEESSVPLSYLSAVHEAHEDWILRKKFPCNTKLILIAAKKDAHDLEEDLFFFKKSISVKKARKSFLFLNFANFRGFIFQNILSIYNCFLSKCKFVDLG